MKEYYILLDVGGTNIKGCIADEKGSIAGEIAIFDALSDKEEEAIFGNFARIISSFMLAAGDSCLSGIGLAFPGPFDYEKGICMMQGIGKYESIVGLCIEAEVKRRLTSICEVPFYFMNDVTTFALGEMNYGQAMNSSKCLCICIGTGIGSAFIVDGEVVTKQEMGIPENGWIYKQPYKESIADDYISVRGLARLSEKVLGIQADGRQLYDLCQQEVEQSLAIYREFGEDLKEILLPILREFMPTKIIFGGQISKSFTFFGNALLTECQNRGIEISIEKETSKIAMQGLLVAIKQQKGRG